MAIDTIWVFSQSADGAPTTGTLELLSKARTLGAGEVAAFHVGDATGGRGRARRPRRHEGLLDGRPRRAPAGAGRGQRHGGAGRGGLGPSLIMFPQNYEGRDVMARLSVKLDRTVLTNNVDIAVDGDGRGGDDADLRWQRARHDHVHG